MAKRQNQSVIDTVELRLPMCEPEMTTYIAKENGHIDMHLRGVGLEAFRRVHAGLIEDGAKLANGRPVSSKAEVIQYLFERVGG